MAEKKGSGQVRHYGEKQLIKTPDGWVPTSEAAQLLAVEQGTVRRLVVLKVLECNYIGPKMFISTESIERYKAARGGRKGGRPKGSKNKPKEDKQEQ